MAFCKRCNCVYHGASWLGEYCSQRCAYDDNRDDWRDCAPLYDPNDPTGSGVIAANRNEVEAMLEAGAIDKRLPKIIYLRKRGKSLREVANACDCGKSTVDRLLRLGTPNLLRECGLQRK